MGPPVYLGIDLSSSPARPSGYALSDGPRLIDVGLLGTDEEVLALSCRYGPRYVAIDAPLGLPAGMDCLEESCACRALAPDGFRATEREVRRVTNRIFYTTKRSIIKRMVYRAIGLRERLEQHGFSVLEVFPYASTVQLFGLPPVKKRRAAWRYWLRPRLEGLVGGLSDQGPLTHDELDAVIAGYTAYLLSHGLAALVGDPAEGAICVPRPLSGE